MFTDNRTVPVTPSREYHRRLPYKLGLENPASMFGLSSASVTKAKLNFFSKTEPSTSIVPIPKRSNWKTVRDFSSAGRGSSPCTMPALSIPSQTVATQQPIPSAAIDNISGLLISVAREKPMRKATKHRLVSNSGGFIEIFEVVMDGNLQSAILHKHNTMVASPILC